MKNTKILKLTASLLGSTWICLSAYGVKNQPNMPQNTWSFTPSSTPLPPPPQNTFSSSATGMLSGTPSQSNTWTSYTPLPPQSTFSAMPVQSSVWGSPTPLPLSSQNVFGSSTTSTFSGTPSQSNMWTSYTPLPPQSTFSAMPAQSSVYGSSTPPPSLQNTFSATPVYPNVLSSVATPPPMPTYSQGVAPFPPQNVGHFVPPQQKTSSFVPPQRDFSEKKELERKASYFEKQKDYQTAAECYKMITEIYMPFIWAPRPMVETIDFYESAAKYFKKAAKSYELARNIEMAFVCYENAAKNYVKAEAFRWEEMQKCFLNFETLYKKASTKAEKKEIVRKRSSEGEDVYRHVKKLQKMASVCFNKMGDCKEGEESLELYEAAAEYSNACVKRNEEEGEGGCEEQDYLLAAECHGNAAVSFRKASSRCERMRDAERAKEYKEKAEKSEEQRSTGLQLASDIGYHKLHYSPSWNLQNKLK